MVPKSVYLRSTMKQKRLNNLMIIHVHKEKVDNLDIIAVANEFVNKNETRKKNFGKFIKQDLLIKPESTNIGTQLTFVVFRFVVHEIFFCVFYVYYASISNNELVRRLPF